MLVNMEWMKLNKLLEEIHMNVHERVVLRNSSGLQRMSPLYKWNHHCNHVWKKQFNYITCIIFLDTQVKICHMHISFKWITSFKLLVAKVSYTVLKRKDLAVTFSIHPSQCLLWQILAPSFLKLAIFYFCCKQVKSFLR